MKIMMLSTFENYSKGKVYDLPEIEAKNIMRQGLAYNSEPLEDLRVLTNPQTYEDVRFPL